MTSKTIVKHSEELRRAVRWISDCRKADPGVNLGQLLSEAGPKFNLTPKDQDGLRLLLREDDER
ncbi:MAG: hypothetical protein JRJ19_04200 [Deltaproteobacteria bacterium]|nr:hypothetical protein [Deltaproteobacteria bacterium]MBW1871241.1 hypothetical protein [Deltaproteobacteria bacterium]